MRRAGALILALALGLTAPQARACAFHYQKPAQTAVDWLVSGTQVVLARPDPERPFQFAVTEVLRGTGPGIDLPYLVDSVTRRKLGANPQDAVLFARIDGGDWARVAYVDDGFRQVMQAALQNTSRWSLGYSEDRFDLFESLQDHPDPALRQLALQEIDKAPYAMLRDLDLRLPADRLVRQMWSKNGYAYQSIRVLLLGLDGSDVARAEIHDFIDRVADWDRANNFGAFATALVELDGTAGVDKLERLFLTDRYQPLSKIEQVVEALAIHNGVADDALQARISLAMRRLVDTRADAAAAIARQFTTRSDWTQAMLLDEVLSKRTNAAAPSLLPVAIYVGQARMAGVFENGG